MNLAEAQDIGPNFDQTFSYAAVHFGDVPAECIARVVGHDPTILYERPPEVALHAPTSQQDFRASDDLLLDPDQKQKRLDLIRHCVPFCKRLTEKSLKKNLLQHQEKGTAVNTRTAGVVQ